MEKNKKIKDDTINEYSNKWCTILLRRFDY